MRARFFLCILLLLTKVSFADVFYVTSNGDNGSGTLRDAILKAGVNGTAVKDYIYFNIPASDANAVTIILASELPALSSNTIIDATTQPGTWLGSNVIKVKLFRGSAVFFNGLVLKDVKDIEIYGIHFDNFKSAPGAEIIEQKAGIYLEGIENVTIGAKNKGNCFTANFAGVLSPFLIPRKDVLNLQISANIFGLDVTGLKPMANDIGIDISFMKAGMIGGNDPGEGNVISGNNIGGIKLGGAGDVVIKYNKMGTDISGNSGIAFAANKGIEVSGGTAAPYIAYNVIGNHKEGIFIDGVKSGNVVIEENYIGLSLDGNMSFSNSTGIYFKFSGAGRVTGNTIAHNDLGIMEEITYPVSILKNSFFCNKKVLDTLKLPTGYMLTQSRISLITATEVRGTYLPNSTIELFYVDDRCTPCQGKTWIATIPTDAAGNWNYSGSINGPITSMGTNADGATASFSLPYIPAEQPGLKIMSTLCGEKDGQITGLRVYDARYFTWYKDGESDPVGNMLDLIGVGPGTYRLKAGQKGLCDVEAGPFMVPGNDNAIDPDGKVQLSDALCGGATGSIKGILTVNDLPRKWYNEHHEMVAQTKDLLQVPAGAYYFTTGEGPCLFTSPSYTIKNISKKFTVSSGYKITPANCDLPNGAIRGITFAADVPEDLQWLNEAGTEVGRQLELTGMTAGRYRLMASNGSECKQLAGEFMIPLVNKPDIDFSGMKRYLECDGEHVGARGIVLNGSPGPYSYTWRDHSGKTVSDELNPKNLGKGNYQLQVTDQYGCRVESEWIDFTVFDTRQISVPNTISPNGDGVNDSWNIQGLESYPDAEIHVFSRNGLKVYQYKSEKKSFDGMYRGKPLPAGTYYYIINLEGPCKAMSGSLLIIR